MESGSVADWVNAIGTLLAFAGATAAVVIARRSYETQLRQTTVQIAALEQAEQQRRAEEERAQASRVAFWVGVVSQGPGVAYVNLSGLPVYDVVIRTLVLDRTFTTEYRALGPNTGEFFLGRVNKTLLEGMPNDRGLWHELLQENRFACIVGFRDASDRWWMRDRHGKLSGHEDRSALLAAIDAEIVQHHEAG
jgi:hypothetical protein